MPSIRAYNQMGPFWDWVASMEDQSYSHPWFGGRNDDRGEGPSRGPWQSWAGNWGPWGANLPHHEGPWGRRRGPFPPGAHPPRHGEEDGNEDTPAGPAPPDYEKTPNASGDEMEAEEEGRPTGETDEETLREDPLAAEASNRKGRDGGRRRGACGMRGRGGMGGRGGGPHGSSHGHFHPGRHHGRMHGFGRHGPGGHDHHGPRDRHHGHRAFPFGGMGGFGDLAEMFQNQLFGDQSNNNNNRDANAQSTAFKPEVDVFDASEAFVVHVSLPGAKKEDVGVHWDAEKSELSIAGVVYRPGDEEFLKTLAMDERKVGEFERSVRLGSRANPAHVDVEGITARMEDGILRIEVPKLDSGYVEIKRVDIE